jgi:hypothetical protein
MHEAYQPVIDDGRGRFPEDLRVKAPRGARAAIAAGQSSSTPRIRNMSARHSCAVWKPMELGSGAGSSRFRRGISRCNRGARRSRLRHQTYKQR